MGSFESLPQRRRPVKSSPSVLHLLCCILLEASIIAFCATSINAQTDKPTVYVVKVTQNAASALHGDLSDFTTAMLKLRLKELNSFKVEDTNVAPKCRETAKVAT